MSLAGLQGIAKNLEGLKDAGDNHKILEETEAGPEGLKGISDKPEGLKGARSNFKVSKNPEAIPRVLNMPEAILKV